MKIKLSFYLILTCWILLYSFCLFIFLIKKKCGYQFSIFIIITMLIAEDVLLFLIIPLDPVNHLVSLADRMFYLVSALIIILTASLEKKLKF